MNKQTTDKEYVLSDFDYQLPPELIAQKPSDKRDESRLMLAWDDFSIVPFSSIINEFNQNDVLVINNSKVMKARFYATSVRTQRIHEILFVSPLKSDVWEVMIHNIKKLVPGDRLCLGGDCFATLLSKGGNTNQVRIDDKQDIFSAMEKYGIVPLPPYIKRKSCDFSLNDEARYQTVYSRNYGSCAAPTAGLHFTLELMDHLKSIGVTIVETTLHVGPGTFLPVKSEKISDHRMHSERIELSEESACILNKAKKMKKRITAAGTTSLRVIESCFKDNVFIPFKGLTDIFIYPPGKVLSSDRLITNFHLPKSTLLMLAGAFAGMNLIRNVYSCAVRNRMRFFSYGDAMLLRREESE